MTKTLAMGDYKSEQSTESKNQGDGSDSEAMDSPIMVHRHKIGVLFKGDLTYDCHL